ncbi:N-acetyltransferase [Bacillus sp. JCM 19041]|uniref:GNAT family N-acetyltransferase n=1 Tax=Bacillus sp. JCM 19041 TaxID=1460637 RepID=UPI0006D1B29E
MTIRLATEEDSEEIVLLLNETTVDLHQKGIMQWEYPWDKQMILNRITHSFIYVLEQDRQVIGTFYLTSQTVLNSSSLEGTSKYLGQIALKPAFQGQQLGSKMIKFALDLANQEKATLYLDCWAGNKKLKAFYTSVGMHYVGDFPHNGYNVSQFHSLPR